MCSLDFSFLSACQVLQVLGSCLKRWLTQAQLMGPENTSETHFNDQLESVDTCKHHKLNYRNI